MEKWNKKEKSIAVLPFVNMSADDEVEYFSDGITEEIINALARIEQLKVTSRTSSFYYKNKKAPINQIARELNVETILEGSVRLAGKTIRITAQLIHAKEDFHFWSQSWDRKLENIFEIQDEISLLIADKLREQYGHFEIQDHLVEKKTDSLEAYKFSLKAKYHFNKWNPVDTRKAIELYEKAIVIDPNHTDSYIGLADAYSFLAVTELMPREEAWEKSKEYTDKAFSLEPENPGVHYLFANISFFYDADFQGAFKHGIRSMELKPNYPEAQQFISMLYMISGDHDKAKHHLENAHRIDPLSQETLFYRGYYHYRTNNYKEALSIFEECLTKNPMNIPAFVVRSYCFLKLGEFETALKSLEQMPQDILPSDERLGIETLSCILKDDTNNTNDSFLQLKNTAINSTSFQAHAYLYLAYATMRKADEAFAFVEQAINLKSPVLLLNYTDPLADNLIDDPRYSKFKNRLYHKQMSTEKTLTEKSPLLDQEMAEEISESITKYMAEEKPFLVPNLSLRMLAEQVEMHPNKLSWLLNERMGKNFNEFINYYRIAYFNELALDPANSHISLIGLAYESGFNSKTVFNTYFKKEMGMTPKEFLKQNNK